MKKKIGQYYCYLMHGIIIFKKHLFAWSKLIKRDRYGIVKTNKNHPTIFQKIYNSISDFISFLMSCDFLNFRYTFNMVTMMKEKVNTHFSFPPQLDMAPYMESNLIKKERLQGK